MRDSILRGSISPTATPPEVTIASSIGRACSTVRVRCLSTPSSDCRSSLVIVFIFLCSGMPDRRMTTGIRLRGSKSPSALAISRFEYFAKSESRRMSSIFSSSAGFRSSSTVYLPGSIAPRRLDALRAIGPDMPKCVNSISPKSSYTAESPRKRSFTFSAVLRRESP